MGTNYSSCTELINGYSFRYQSGKKEKPLKKYCMYTIKNPQPVRNCHILRLIYVEATNFCFLLINLLLLLIKLSF